MLFLATVSTNHQLPHQHHTPPQLRNLPHHIRITDQPAIHPCRGILPIPACGIIGCFEDHLPPAVVNYHAELTNQVFICNRAEGVIQAVIQHFYPDKSAREQHFYQGIKANICIFNGLSVKYDRLALG